MSFDKRHYKTIKKFMLDRLTHRPWCYEGSPVDWAVGLFPLIQQSIDDEDYEAAQATKDAIIEFFNSMGADVPNDAKLILTRK